MSSVTFVVGKEGKQESLKCYRALLSCHSDVFKSMLMNSNKDEDLPKVVNLSEDDPTVFAEIIRFVDTNNVQLCYTEQLIRFYHAASKYNMNGAKRQCVELLHKNIIVETAALLLELANEYNEHNLSYSCWKFILKESDAVLQAPTFKTLKQDTVAAIIRQDSLNVTSEVKIYEAIVAWAKWQCNNGKTNGEDSNNIRHLLQPLLCHIRYNCISYQEFVSMIQSDEIFTDFEQLEVLKRLVCPELTMLAQEFNFSLIKRTWQRVTQLKSSVTYLDTSDISSDGAFLASECFQANNHNLYVFGVTLESQRCFNSACTLTIKNATTNLSTTRNVSVDNYKYLISETEPMFIAKGEICQIVFKYSGFYDSKRKYLKCENKLNPLLERVSNFPGYEDSMFHFESIIAIPVNV